MSEILYDRIKENLAALKMKNTLEILDNYLERAIKDDLNIVDVLDHILSEEARSKRDRAYEKQIQMSGFPIKKGLDEFDFSCQPSIDKRQIDELATMRFVENAENIVFLGPPGVGKTHLANALGMVAAKNRYSTYYTNCHTLIENLKRSHYENRLHDKLRTLVRYKVLIIDEIGYLPMDIGAQTCSSSLSPSGMRKPPLSLPQIKLFPSGMRFSRTSPSPPPFLTGCSTTAPLSTSRARATSLKSARST